MSPRPGQRQDRGLPQGPPPRSSPVYITPLIIIHNKKLFYPITQYKPKQFSLVCLFCVSRALIFSIASVVLKVWSTDQQHQHHLEAC